MLKLVSERESMMKRSWGRHKGLAWEMKLERKSTDFREQN